MRLLLWVLAIGVGAVQMSPAAAADTGDATAIRQPLTVDFGASHERLSGNFANWKSTYAEAAYRLGERHTVYGGVRETRRFGADDNEAYAGLYYPLAATWTAVVDGSVSPTHEILPRYSAHGQLLKSIRPGTTLGAGVRHTEYKNTGANVAMLAAEQYWRSWRGAYTFYSGRPEGTSSAPAHRFQADYYYAEHSVIGISHVRGREVENVGGARGVISTEVRDWTLTGRHWLSRDWAVAYELLYHEQGTLYRRQGVRLGLRHAF